MNYAIAGLVAMSLLASFFVIFSYNRSVNLEHEISVAELSIRKFQTDKAQLQDKMFVLLSDVNLKKFSSDRNLVEEKNPQYIKTSARNGGELAVSQTR